MKYGKRFSFYKIQRRGLLSLWGILLLFLGGTAFIQLQKNSAPTEQIIAENEEIQLFIDSLKRVKEEKKDYQLMPFNPNFITDYKGYQLGLSTEEIDRLSAFRKKDKWINSIKEFQQVTGVSDSVLAKISPLFKFPEWVQQQQSRQQFTTSVSQKVTLTKADLNRASAEDLQQVKGIGEVLSTRIVRHRAQLGGFRDDIQLKDIYGLKYEMRQAILAQFTVKKKDSLKRIDLNKASVADLLEVYYINYELARKIVNYRITREGFANFEQLAEIEGFPVGRMEQIQLYLKIENP